MKAVLAKHKLSDLVASGYDGDVLVPVDAESEKAIGKRSVIGVKILGIKATMTALQRKAIHLYFTHLSKALNDAGYDMIATMAVLSKKAKIPWSAEAVKERLWRPVQIDTYGKESTTELNTENTST